MTNHRSDEIDSADAPREVPKRSRLWRAVLPGAILLVGLGIAAFLALAPRGEARVPRAELVPLVEIARLRTHVGPVDLYADGVVVSHREIQLAAQVEGTIVYKSELCRAGFYVPPRTLLLRIDPTDYQLQVQRLEQEVRQAANTLDQLNVELGNLQELLRVAKADYELEKRSFARQEELYRKRVISDEDYEQAQRALLKSENALVSLENQLRSAQARKEGLEAALGRAQTQLAEAKTRLSRTEIYSPPDVETVVMRETVEVGDYVRSGTVLAVLEDVSQMEVRVSLRRDQLSWIWAVAPQGSADRAAGKPQDAYRLPELPVTVIHELEGAQYAWEGKLWRYEGLGVNESTRTIPCRVLVPEVRKSRPLRVPQGWRSPAGPPALMRGMFVSLRIHLPAPVPILAVPEQALQPGNWVWRCELSPSGSELAQSSSGGNGQAEGAPQSEASASTEAIAGQSGDPRSGGDQLSGGQTDADRPAGGVRGRIYRVEVAPVSWRSILQIVYAEKGGETIVDGKTLKFDGGRLVRLLRDGTSSEVLYEGPVTVRTPAGPVPVDGVRYQVVDGILYEATAEGLVVVPEPDYSLPPGAPFGFRQVKEILVPARPGYLDPNSCVVLTPLMATDGTVVEVRSLP